jgi:phage shock protein A
MSRRPGFLRRFFGLLRGGLTGWIRDREEENPRAVYEAAISERLAQYRELKGAVAGILYMRNKLEGELDERRAEMARTHEDIRRAVKRGDDEVGLALISHTQILVGDIERCEKEYEDLRANADEAKANLVRFREEIRALEREKGRVVATLANAEARKRMNDALEGISVDADVRALESVREHLAKLQTEGTLDQELGRDFGLSARIKAIREEASQDAARIELDEIKRKLNPVPLPAESGAKVVTVAAS